MRSIFYPFSYRSFCIFLTFSFISTSRGQNKSLACRIKKKTHTKKNTPFSHFLLLPLPFFNSYQLYVTSVSRRRIEVQEKNFTLFLPLLIFLSLPFYYPFHFSQTHLEREKKTNKLDLSLYRAQKQKIKTKRSLFPFSSIFFPFSLLFSINSTSPSI